MEWARSSKSTGFTIVELLIVIIVIGILAAVTIVAFNGVKNKAVTAQVQSALEQANKKIQVYAVQNSSMYPATLAAAGVTDDSGIKYQYTSDNTLSPPVYALTVSNDFNGSISYYLSSTQPKMSAGVAPGHNLAVWDKPNASTAPIAVIGGVTIDTTTYRTATSSLRISPASTGRTFAGNPFSGTAGQVYTVSMWVKSDATWNGLANNSKVRFGSSPGGALLTACGYDGVKLSWTFVTCSYTLTASNTAVALTVGNDGTTGNVWIDDITVSLQ